MTDEVNVCQEIRRKRIARCEEANTDEATRMRHCERCEVPVGIMGLPAFNALHRCGVCSKLVHGGGE